MWYAQILNSLEVDDFSEELLQDVTSHLQSITVNDFTKGYEIIVQELVDMSYDFMDRNQLPASHLIIQYLQIWNQEVCTFSNIWILQNLEIAYQIKINRTSQAKARLVSLIDEQQYYSIGGSLSQTYESALTLHLYCNIDHSGKQLALQAVLKLQQLIIKVLEPKFSKKVHLLMAKLYEQMGNMEKGVYEANQFYSQAYKVASQVLTPNDSLLQHYEQHIQIETESQPPKPLSITNSHLQDVLLEERDIVISDQGGLMKVTYNNKTKEVQIQFLQAKCLFNLSDIENEIMIYNMCSFPVFLNEFVNQISQLLTLEDTLVINNNLISLESYDKSIQLTQKTRGHYFAYFTEQNLDYTEEGSVHPLLIQ